MSNYKDNDKKVKNEKVETKVNNDKETEQQPKRVKKLKVSKNLKRVLIGTAAVLVIGGGIGVAGKMYFDTRPVDIDMTTTEVVSLISDESTIDEVCAIVDSTACSDMDELQEKVELSEKLHELDLDKYVDGLDEYETPESYTVEEVEDLITTFEDYLENEKVKNGVLSTEDREATKIALTLKSYETLVNSDIDESSYSVLANALLALVKSKTLDACYFDADEVSNMTLSLKGDSCAVTFADNETGKKYEVGVCNNNVLTNAGYINKVVNSICDYQDKAADVISNKGIYDADRNKSILDGINMFNTLALMDCEITNKGELRVVDNMYEVKEKVKTLTNSETTGE